MWHKKLSQKDLLGKTFNSLTIKSFSHVDGLGQDNYVCLCACGEETVRIGREVRNNSIRSCGCGIDNRDITGLKFGAITVLGKTDGNACRERYRAKCSCGIRFTVQGERLRKGRISSCGCKRTEYDDVRGAEFKLINLSKMPTTIQAKVSGFLFKAIRSSFTEDVTKVTVKGVPLERYILIERGEKPATKLEEEKILKQFGITQRVFDSNLKKYSKVVKGKVEDVGMDCEMTLEDLIDRILINLIRNK